jgi:hypothetical protein
VSVSSISRAAATCHAYGLRNAAVRIKFFISGIQAYHKQKADI